MRIVLVEDNAHDRAAYKRVLRAALPCEILECFRGEEALGLIESSPDPIDVILVDHGLPGMSGLDFYRRLAEQENPPATVIITGSGSEDLARDSIKTGIADYIVKDSAQDYLRRLPTVVMNVVHERARRRAREEDQRRIREAAIRRRALINGLPVGVISLDENHRITEMNTAAEQLTGFSSAESLGEPCEEILRADVCGPGCPLTRALNDRRSQGPVECNLHNRAGEVIPVNLTAAGIFDDEDRLLGGVEIFQDLRLIKRMEQERATMLSVLAHDMKTPLVSIKGFSKLILSKGQTLPGDKLREYEEIVYREADALESLILDFLESARSRHGQLQLKSAALDIGDFLAGLHHEQAPRFREKGLALELSLEGLAEEKVIQADKTRLHRALSNLLDNALIHSEPGGAVRLAAVSEAGWVTLAVADQGVGLTEDEQANLFQPFFRGAGKRSSSGHGLGLVGVKNIALAHGGGVEVQSEPGKGAVFTIRIPASAAATGRDASKNS